MHDKLFTLAFVLSLLPACALRQVTDPPCSTPDECGVCGCALPDAVDPDCHVATVAPDGGCSWARVPDEAPCRQGVGVCRAGACLAVDGPRCSAIPAPPAPAAEPWPTCSADVDCDDGNPCTIDSCPRPECGVCLHVPAPNGPCDDGVCFTGAHCIQA
jgi:hypothetical protein